MLQDIVRRRAELSPERPALHWAGRWHTYAELNRRAEATAARLGGWASARAIASASSR